MDTKLITIVLIIASVLVGIGAFIKIMGNTTLSNIILIPAAIVSFISLIVLLSKNINTSRPNGDD